MDERPRERATHDEGNRGERIRDGFAICASSLLVSSARSRREADGQLGLKLDQRGNVIADENYMTSVPGVFAAGDMRRGQSLVVWRSPKAARPHGGLISPHGAIRPWPGAGALPDLKIHAVLRT